MTLSKKFLFNTTAIITVITLISFVMANYKYNNFLLTNVNMIYITSLILGLVVAYLAYGSKPAKVPSKDDTDKILAEKYIEIYQLVFELLTIDAIIANNRTEAFNKAIGTKPGTEQKIATIENINLEMTTIRSEKNTLYALATEDNKKKEIEQVLIKLNALSKAFIVIKASLDKNIIVALQLIYNLDTQDPAYSTEILDRAHGEAIQRLSNLEVSKIKPDNDDKYFDKDVYQEDYNELISKNNELDKALSDFLGKTTQDAYENLADGFKTNQNLSNTNQFLTKTDFINFYLDPFIKSKKVSTSIDALTKLKEKLLNESSKRGFKDLVSQTFNSSSETGGIYRFMDILYDIINEIKQAN